MIATTAGPLLPVIREVQGAGHKSFNAIAGHLSASCTSM